MTAHAAVRVVASLDVGVQRQSLFSELDKRAREIEEQWKSSWLELADLCATIRDNELWREGGYSSFGAWLQNACPTSRSMAYLAMGIREELREIPHDELKQIPLGNADILKHTPKQHRNGKVLAAAKNQPPREFIGTVVRESPDSHLEQKQCHKFRLAKSQSVVLQQGFDMWRFLNEDPHARGEDCLEGIIVDYMLAHQREFESKAGKA
jgi:hypothetical protein